MAQRRDDHVSQLGTARRSNPPGRQSPEDEVQLTQDTLSAAVASGAVADEIARCHSEVGAALRRRYLSSAEPAWLDASVTAFRAAVAAATDGPAHAAHANNLAVALTDRYDLLGEAGDLTEGTDAAWSALAGTPPSSADWPEYAATVSLCLWDRYDATGSLTDLDVAVDLTGTALAATPQEAAFWPRLCSNLGMLLLDRYERRGDRPDLHAAVELARSAVTGCPADDPDLPGWLNNLGNALRIRFASQFGDHDSPLPEEVVVIADLEEAVDVYRIAAQLVPRRAVARPTFLTNLGSALLDASALHDLRSRPDLALQTVREAVRVLHRAVALTPAGVPYLAGRLNVLAVAHRWVAERTGAPADVAIARRMFRRACRAGLSSAPEMTVAAADNWIRWSVARQAWKETGEADDYLLTAAESLQRAQATHGHRQDWLVALRGLAQECGYAAVRRGRSTEAVTRLERARAVLLSEALDLAPRTLERLPADLRERYSLASAALAAARQQAVTVDPLAAG
jgi:tetratricopeptide (TPR) repeat protein